MPRTQTYHLHLPHVFQDKKASHLSKLYGVRVARDLVMKLAIFFFPIYLYQQGTQDPFWQFIPGGSLQKGILLLVLFYLVHRLTVTLTVIPVGKIITKIGYQRAMLIGFSLFALFLSLLYWRENPGWLLLAAAVVSGLETDFFWSSYFTLISKFTLRNQLGQDLGLLNFFLQLAQVVAPAVGGSLIITLGFKSLFLVGIVGILMAMLFVLGLQIEPERDVVSWAEFISWVKERSFLQLAVSQVGRYFNDSALVFWPLYIYLILGSVDRVGFLYTFSLFLAMIVSLGAGFYIDQRQSKKPFYVSGGVLSVLWVLRTQVISFWQIAIIDTIDRLTASFYALYYDTIAFKRGQGSQALSFFVYRELIVSMVAVIFWVLLGSLFLIISRPWEVLFIGASVGVLLGLLVKEKHSLLN